MSDCYSKDQSKWIRPIFLISNISNIVASVGCFYFIIAVLSRNSVRSNTFNIYIVLLLLPDGIVNLVSGVRGARFDSYPIIYDFTTFFFYFGNFYLDCCVAYELYAMVERSRRCSRTGPPTARRVITQVSCVYSLSFLFALWGLLDVPWSWYDNEKRILGSPEGGLFSQLGAMILVLVCMLIPITYVVYVSLRIRKSKMLQREGPTKALYLFFERIVIVFLALFFPGVCLNMALGIVERKGNAFFVMTWTIHMILALQVSTTLYMVSFKQDIREALVCNYCRLKNDDGGEVSGAQSSRGIHGSITNATKQDDGTHTTKEATTSHKSVIEIPSGAFVGDDKSRIFEKSTKELTVGDGESRAFEKSTLELTEEQPSSSLDSRGTEMKAGALVCNRVVEDIAGDKEVNAEEASVATKSDGDSKQKYSTWHWMRSAARTSRRSSVDLPEIRPSENEATHAKRASAAFISVPLEWPTPTTVPNRSIVPSKQWHNFLDSKIADDTPSMNDDV